jgi:DNA-binding beta-propeller fold protein YncE
MYLFPVIVTFLVAFSILSQVYGLEKQKKETYSYVFKWGSMGSGDGQFMAPHDIDFDSLGNVYVSDRLNNNIQKFTHDGKYILQWGKEGSNKGEFKVPYSISIDKSDNVYVVDRQNNRTQKFTSNGSFLSQCGTISGN